MTMLLSFLAGVALAGAALLLALWFESCDEASVQSREMSREDYASGAQGGH